MKRRVANDASPADTMSITPLGAGNEVGRSCILLQYKNKTVMLDCGIHPGYSGLSALPFFDEIDPASVDVLLISHFHLDHAASLPYFMEKTNFRGRVFMTHPTKAIYKWLLSDYIKISNVSIEDMLYDEQDLLRSYERIEAIDFHQEMDIEGVKFTAFNAGHVLGAAMFVIEIAGVKVLYTGDYSREEDRHLMAAERPPGLIPDVMICESTYGVQSNEPRATREARFTGLIHEVVTRGGRCLIPAFALGRAQELLLILDEYWQAHPELHSVPIFYASSLAKKCMAVYQTYVNMMNARIRKQFAVSNPFIFKHISNLKSVEQFDDAGPCVMMASPAMLQSGLSRELFERWCSDKRNGLIIPGYVVEGTLAKHVLTEPQDISTMDGRKLPLRMKVDYISFSAHVDYTQNSEFIDEMNPTNLVLVHGEANEMFRLKVALQDKYASREQAMKIFTPKNCEALELYFRGEKMAKTIGSLAAEKPHDHQHVSGILVGKDYQYHIIADTDLLEFTELKPCVIKQKQCISYHGPFELVRFHLIQMFGACEELVLMDDSKLPGSPKKKAAHNEVNVGVKVFDVVEVKRLKEGQLILEWTGNAVNDMIADAVIAIVLGVESSPASVKLTKHEHSHGHDRSEESERRAYVESVLRSFFDEEKDEETGTQQSKVTVDKKSTILKIQRDQDEAKIDLATLAITTDSEELRKQIKSILQEAMIVSMPLGEPWSLGTKNVV